MQFKFSDGEDSGWMAFTGPPTARRLLVTDAGHDAVHIIDVVARTHAGYVAAPGSGYWSISGPRGIAARGSLVAVTVWKDRRASENVIHLFEGSGSSWKRVRVLSCDAGRPGKAEGKLDGPCGLRFTRDGTGLVVADSHNRRVCQFRVDNGSFVRSVATGLDRPSDVEECEGGWLVCGANYVYFVGDKVSERTVDAALLGSEGRGDGEFYGPSSLALVPGLGVVVREWTYGRVQVFV